MIKAHVPAWAFFATERIPIALRQIEVYRELRAIQLNAMTKDERYQAAINYCQELHARNPFIDPDTLVEIVSRKFNLDPLIIT